MKPSLLAKRNQAPSPEFGCPECGRETVKDHPWERAVLVFLAALFLVGLALSLPAVSALTIFLINVVVLVPALPPARCPHCSAMLKRNPFLPKELVYNSFILGLLPVFLLINSIKPVLEDFTVTALLAALWAAGMAYKAMPKRLKLPKALKETEAKERPEREQPEKPLPKKQAKARILDKSGRFLRKYVCSNCGTELDNESVPTCPKCQAILERKPTKE